MSWGLVAAAAATVGSAVISSNASSNAADTQAQSARDAQGLQKQMFDKQIELQEPFRQAGLTAQNKLLMLLGLSGDPSAAGYGSLAHDFGASDFQQDPGYQFRLSEGTKAIDRAAAAGGRFNSGRSAKDLMRFSQGLASQEYGNAFDRFQVGRTNRLNPLQAILGQGQSSANQIGADAGAYGRSASDLITGAGNARAAGIVGGANAWNNAAGQGVSMYQQNQLLKALRPPSSSGGVSGFGSGSDADQFWG